MMLTKFIFSIDLQHRPTCTLLYFEGGIRLPTVWGCSEDVIGTLRHHGEGVPQLIRQGAPHLLLHSLKVGQTRPHTCSQQLTYTHLTCSSTGVFTQDIFWLVNFWRSVITSVLISSSNKLTYGWHLRKNLQFILRIQLIKSLRQWNKAALQK